MQILFPHGKIMVQTITVKVTVEDCDVAGIKEQLHEWYSSNKIGIAYFDIE